MEHLVDDAERAVLQANINLAPQIPWLDFDHDTTKLYLPVYIEEYPLQRGWTQGEIRKVWLGEVPASRKLLETLSMLQSWLFFGLLESAFGESFSTRDYIRQAERRDVMDTSKLRSSIENYQAYLRSDQASESLILEQRERMVKSLKYAQSWNERLAVFSGFGYPLATNSEMLTHVARLAILVGEAVWAIGQQIPSLEARPFIDCTWNLEPGHQSELRSRVTAQGWCPLLFDRLDKLARLPASLLEYMSIRPCLKIAPNHHEGCQTRCSEYNVTDPSTYQAAHREKGCNCPNVQFSELEVEQAFNASAIPLVDTEELLTSKPEAVVKLWSPITPFKFVAFSHVWSDGLGSDTKRGLPTCQVKYLRDLAIKACGTPLIWIDALCIPRRRDLRRTAISRLSESYRSAFATVVLDAGMKHCSMRDSDQAHLLSVSLSTWQERLWTLSESVLSTRVMFAFADGLKSSKDLLDVGHTGKHIPVVYMGCKLLDNLSHGMFIGDVTIGALQHNLCRRTSSWRADESLATATIMGLDLARILEMEVDDNGNGSEERMMRFWSMAEWVPRGIIIESSPKFSVDGFRWAPKSLMNLKCDIMMDVRDQSATVTEHGLRGTFVFYRLYFPNMMTWTRTMTFTDTSTGCCLSVDKFDLSVEYTLLPGDVLCFSDNVNISQPLVGALLRPLPHQPGTSCPVFRFGALATARFDPVSELEGMEGRLGNLIKGALGWVNSWLSRAEEEKREIIIC